MRDRAQAECAQYKSFYGDAIPGKLLAERMAHYYHLFTLYWTVRPFGCSSVLACKDFDGYHLYLLEQNGECTKMKGACVGKGKSSAKTEVEKLNFSEITCEEAVKELARIVYATHDVKDKEFECEMSWICDASGRRFVRASTPSPNRRERPRASPPRVTPTPWTPVSSFASLFAPSTDRACNQTTLFRLLSRAGPTVSASRTGSIDATRRLPAPSRAASRAALPSHMHRARGRLASVFVLLSTVARSARAFTAHGFIPEYRPTSIAADACEGARVRVLAFSATPNGVRGDGLDGLDAVPRRPTGRGAAGNACAWDLVVGGGGRSDGFRRALGDVDALAREVVTAVTDGGYDGVSYDWEYPTNDDEWEAYGRLLRRTRERLDQDAASSGRRALSFAVHVTPETFDAIEKFKLTDVVDWVHLMTYDSGFPSGHASLRVCARGVAVLDNDEERREQVYARDSVLCAVGAKPRGCEDIRRVASGHDENVRRIGESHRGLRVRFCVRRSRKGSVGTRTRIRGRDGVGARSRRHAGNA